MELDPRTALALEALAALGRAGLLDAFDLELAPESEDDTSATLDRWFDGADWRQGGHRVQRFAQDGGDGMYCLWAVEGRPPEVVLFGSEGELAACAGSLEAFVRRLAEGDAARLHVVAWQADDPREPGPDLPAMRRVIEAHLPGPAVPEPRATDFVPWALSVIAEREARSA